MRHSIQLILFDLGGVLVRICHGWKNACKHNGLVPPTQLDDPQWSTQLDDVGIRFETGRSDEATYIKEAAALTGFSPEQIRTALHRWLIEPYPGARELVALVAEKSRTMTACLSNTNATHWAMMNGEAGFPAHAKLPLHLLDHRFASHLIGAMKPAAAIYEHVERELNIDPASILFFEDHPPNVAGARARGWQVDQIDPATGDSPAQIREHLRRRGLI
jgi:FMN phosphatase YigB (HAD superfamily)